MKYINSLPTWLLALLILAAVLHFFPSVRAKIASVVPIPGL